MSYMARAMIELTKEMVELGAMIKGMKMERNQYRAALERIVQSPTDAKVIAETVLAQAQKGGE